MKIALVACINLKINIKKMSSPFNIQFTIPKWGDYLAWWGTAYCPCCKKNYSVWDYDNRHHIQICDSCLTQKTNKIKKWFKQNRIIKY